MERKLVRQGRNALTVTLPAKWLKERGIIAGNTVQITEKNTELVINSELKTAKRETTLDLKDMEDSMAYHLVQGKYIEGFDTIILLNTSRQLVEKMAQTLLGFIIEEHASTRTVLKNIIIVPEENFIAILRRAAFILLQQALLLEDVALKKASCEDVKAQEHLLDYNLRYCLRYLNKYANDEHAYKYFLLCSTIESAGDQISLLAENIGSDRELAKRVVAGIKEYVRLLFSNDLEKVYFALRDFRNSLSKGSFCDGLAYSLAETLYNFIGYLIADR